MEFLSDELREELESFVAIFEETSLSESDKCVRLKLEIFPSESENDEDKRLSCTIEIEAENDKKICSISRCKGLTNERQTMLDKIVKEMACDSLFEIVDAIRDEISNMNEVPDGECPICLEKFESFEESEKLECYHLFHRDCLWQFWKSALQAICEENKSLPADHKKPEQVFCPTCRIVADIPKRKILKFKPRQRKISRQDSLMDKFAALAIEKQKKFSSSFRKQVDAGGHWDENEGVLVVVRDPVPEPANEPTDKDDENQPDKVKQKIETNQDNKKRNNRRRNYNHRRPENGERNNEKADRLNEPHTKKPEGANRNYKNRQNTTQKPTRHDNDKDSIKDTSSQDQSLKRQSQHRRRPRKPRTENTENKSSSAIKTSNPQQKNSQKSLKPVQKND